MWGDQVKSDLKRMEDNIDWAENRRKWIVKVGEAKTQLGFT